MKEAGEIAGNLHIARSRNDMGIAIYRMTLRKKLLVLMSEMLAFDDIIENSWDAVAGAVQLSALNLRRTVQDFLTWATQEFNVITLADPYV